MKAPLISRSFLMLCMGAVLAGGALTRAWTREDAVAGDRRGADDPEALAQLITVHLRATRDRLALAYEETEAPDPLRMLRP